ncbi:MAG TPA: right-handed parallel beta-helix repeat-containing protein [Desulfuromonadaceae bacterium]
MTKDTVWKGEVALTEDVLVPAGVTLTIAPGAVIRVSNAESSRTEPEFLSPLVEITVRGTLKGEGTPDKPIALISAEEHKAAGWAGIIIDGGSVSLRSCRIESADTAVHLLDGTLDLRDSTVSGNRYGVVIQKKTAALRGEGNRLTENDYGLVAYGDGPPVSHLAGITGNRKKDVLVIPRREYRPAAESAPHKTDPPLFRSYGDEVLNGETVWAQRVEVNGVVRVPEGSRLVILPGTVVRFGFKDTNQDGIGESSLLVQGVIVAKGRADAPIVFAGAGGKGRRGGWDAINIMNSGGAWNLFEHCRFEDAYRGLHFHFSRVAVTGSVFTNCYRGIQFQEASVLLRENRFFGNGSAVQGRDSQVTFDDNLVYDNFQGANFLRVKLEARRNRIVANEKEGVRIREGATVAEENLIDWNRYGLQVMDAYFGSFTRNSISNNGEIGFSLKNSDNMEVAGNFIAGNGVNGLNLQDTRGRISGNLISDNGERGVGIQSFSGIMEGNNFSANGLWAVDLEGSGDVAAPRNWWGGEEPRKVIHDKENGAARGRVEYGGAAGAPFPFPWPLGLIETEAVWRGDVLVKKTVTVAAQANLTLAPRSRALFAEQTGLAVYGRIIAKGESGGRIFFTSSLGKAGSWNEVLLEHADGSSFENCVFEYATWGLHSHFTRLTVRESFFRHNTGGIRFRSGPVEIGDSLFTDNEIGIRDYRGNAVIAGNAITGNGTGIFVREKGGGITVRGNDIFANRDYNLRVGDFNDEDVDARENWWGGSEPGATILDGREEPGIGVVRFEPFLKKPARPGLAETK